MTFSLGLAHSQQKTVRPKFFAGIFVVILAIFGSSVPTSASATWVNARRAVFNAGVQNANPNATFFAVSCASAGNCTAVGNFKNAGGGFEAVTMTSTNGVWANAQPAVFAAGIQNVNPSSNFASVSCASAGNCTTVGNFKNAGGGFEAVTMTSTNGVWANAQPAVFAAGVQDTRPNANLNSVSCASAGNCTAVGGFSKVGGGSPAFTMTSTNGVWANAQQAVFAAGFEDVIPGGNFFAVSCASAGNCTAAGTVRTVSGNSVAFTMTSTNDVWANAQPAIFAAGVQNAAPSDIFRSVSCASAGNCTAGGAFKNVSGNGEAFTMTSTNGVWANAQPAVFAAGVQNTSPQGDINSVSCASAGNCTAAGGFANVGGGNEAFTMTSTNGIWANAQPATFAKGVQNAERQANLYSVSCASAGNCTAAGSFTNVSNGNEAFTMTSTKGVWANAQPVVFAAGVQNTSTSTYFSAVSCASAGKCTAAGTFKNVGGGNEAFTTTSTGISSIDSSSKSSGAKVLPATGTTSVQGLLYAGICLVAAGTTLVSRNRRRVTSEFFPRS
jgi:LPXTG-motif cell wall-anchored protein